VLQEFSLGATDLVEGPQCSDRWPQTTHSSWTVNFTLTTGTISRNSGLTKLPDSLCVIIVRQKCDAFYWLSERTSNASEISRNLASACSRWSGYLLGCHCRASFRYLHNDRVTQLVVICRLNISSRGVTSDQISNIEGGPKSKPFTVAITFVYLQQ